MVLDAGGTLCLSNSVSEASALYTAQAQALISTCAAECMRQHLTDCIEFISDLHTLTKVKVPVWFLIQILLILQVLCSLLSSYYVGC